MKIIHTAAVIVRNGNEVLVTKRGHDGQLDSWEFPTNRVEPGETGKQVCLRETDRNLHIHVDKLEPLCTVQHNYGDSLLYMECFTCVLEDGELRDSEHESFRWLDADELQTVEWLPANAKVAGIVEGVLKGNGSPIGTETMDAILDVTDALLDSATNQFEPNSGIYRINDFGEYVSEKDWERIWSTCPRWWRDAWMLADNGQFRADDVAHMSVEEIERAVNDPEFYPEYAFYTEAGEDGRP